MTLGASDLLVPLLSFALGIVTGLHIRVSRDDRPPGGHTGGVTVSDQPPARRRSRLYRLTRALDRPAVYLVALAGAMALSSAACVLAYQSSGRVGELAACVADYNVDAGEARDERATIGELDRAAERDVWQNLHDQIANPGSKDQAEAQQQALDTIQARIDAIDATTATVFQNPYPDPKRCK